MGQWHPSLPQQPPPQLWGPLSPESPARPLSFHWPPVSVILLLPQTPPSAGLLGQLRRVRQTFPPCPAPAQHDHHQASELSPSSRAPGLGTARAPAYLGLADGAVEGVVFLVVEEAKVQRAQGGCGQSRAQVMHRLHGGEASPTSGRSDEVPVPTVTAINWAPTACSSLHPAFQFRRAWEMSSILPTF